MVLTFKWALSAEDKSDHRSDHRSDHTADHSANHPQRSRNSDAVNRAAQSKETAESVKDADAANARLNA
jgi:hypothetical protein